MFACHEKKIQPIKLHTSNLTRSWWPFCHPSQNYKKLKFTYFISLVFLTCQTHWSHLWTVAWCSRLCCRTTFSILNSFSTRVICVSLLSWVLVRVAVQESTFKWKTLVFCFSNYHFQSYRLKVFTHLVQSKFFLFLFLFLFLPTSLSRLVLSSHFHLSSFDWSVLSFILFSTDLQFKRHTSDLFPSKCIQRNIFIPHISSRPLQVGFVSEILDRYFTSMTVIDISGFISPHQKYS